MRAKAGLAQTLWELGKKTEAVAHYEESLTLNPNDNQGLRYTLASWLLELGLTKKLEVLFKNYRSDGGAMWEFSNALYQFQKLGASSPKAKKQREQAITSNKFVPKYLLGRKKIPKLIPDSYSLKSEEEAIIYASEAIEAWQRTPGAIEWLSE
jgi:tetratricopeptide (TPR) repeat protein